MGRGQRQDLAARHTPGTPGHLGLGDRIKYPRTPHLPESPKRGADDLVLDSATHFEGKQVVVAEKLDGESWTGYADGSHARSPDARDRSETMRLSRDWVRRLHGQFAHELPPGFRVCGENMGGRHTVAYDKLPSLLMVYSIWNERNEALSWTETEEWCELLGLQTVPVLYRGVWDREAVLACGNTPQYSEISEGFVVRLADGFAYEDFGRSIAKYVNSSFEIPSEHWTSSAFTPNGIDPASPHARL